MRDSENRPASKSTGIYLIGQGQNSDPRYRETTETVPRLFCWVAVFELSEPAFNSGVKPHDLPVVIQSCLYLAI